MPQFQATLKQLIPRKLTEPTGNQEGQETAERQRLRDSIEAAPQRQHRDNASETA